MLIVLLMIVLPFILILTLVVLRQPASRASLQIGHKTFGLRLEVERHEPAPPPSPEQG